MIATPLPHRLSDSVVAQLVKIVGERFISTGDCDRIAYSRDCYPKMLIWGRSAKFPHLPSAVVFPAGEKELLEVLRILRKEAIPVIPFGGGSGVAGGTLPVRAGVIVDLKRFNKIMNLDTANQTVTVGAGMLGEHFEHDLNRLGYTLGHFPSSIMCSTVGGWIAARSAGQLSTRYGKIEDMLLGLRFVTPEGKKLEINSLPRTAQSAIALPLLLGGEGTMGVITEATFRVHRFPETRLYRGWRFRNVTEAVGAMRALLQTGLSPACLRLYDELDTLIAMDKKGDGAPFAGQIPLIENLKKFFTTAKHRAKPVLNAAEWAVLKNPYLPNKVISRLPTGCLLIVGFEGEEKITLAYEKASYAILANRHGQDLGRGPGEAWLETRYHISFKQPPLFHFGAFNDTMEVASEWENLLPLYRAVKSAIAPLAFVMAHFSHAYTDGCSIYFTFAGAEESPVMAVKKYDEIWKKALKAVSDTGSTITHHHGVGYLKQGFLFQEFGELISLHRLLKETLDPTGYFNPDKLALGGGVTENESQPQQKVT